MRIDFPSGTRSFPTDRNPLVVALGNTVNPVAGGGASVVVTYTCPAGRRTFLAWTVGLFVTTALAAGQNGNCTFFHSSQVGNAPQLVTPNTAAQGHTQHLAGSVVWLSAGQSVTINTSLTAGAGALAGMGTFLGLEYDA